MKQEKIKQIDLKEIEDKKYLLIFYSKNVTKAVEIDEAICYRLYRQIKKHLKLQ